MEDVEEALTDKRPALVKYIQEFIQRVQEPLGLTGWQIGLVQEEPDAEVDCKASNISSPEYKTAHIRFHLDKLETGDELDELIVHELMHCHTWCIHTLAEENAVIAADCLPDPHKDAFKRGLLEQARIAGEDATTQVAFMAVRLLRRLWKAEAALKETKAELKALRSNK